MSIYSSMKKPEYMSRVEEERWYQLEGRSYQATRFFHLETLQRLGLFGPVSALLENGGLSKFVTLSAPNYPALVREFLATLDVRFDKNIRFRMLGTEYLMPKHTMALALGMSRPWSSMWHCGMSLIPPAETCVKVIGIPEGHEDYHDHSITHPALRLCHRVLSPAFYGLAEPRVVPQRMWMWLYCLMLEATYTPDWVQLFLATCAESLGQKNGRHAHFISFGGMITLIVRYMDIDLHSLQPLHSSQYFDMSTLLSTHIIERVFILDASESFRWLSGARGEHHQYLPTSLPVGPTLAAFHIIHICPTKGLILETSTMNKLEGQQAQCFQDLKSQQTSLGKRLEEIHTNLMSPWFQLLSQFRHQSGSHPPPSQ